MGCRVLITCEHGGNRLPAVYRARFRGRPAVLDSHRGFDAGALELAQTLARHLHAPLVASTITRLLVDLNRSLSNPAVFSPNTVALSSDQRHTVLEHYYFPHRRRVQSWIAETVAREHQVLHISVHSFATRLAGQTRRADVGLLYDPVREAERQLAAAWRTALRARRPDLQVRRNYPYQGRSDGLTTHLRRLFAPPVYLGLELEVNQRWVRRPRLQWQRLQDDLVASLQVVR